MKVALCTPVHSSPKAQFTYCWGKLIAHSTRAGLNIEPFMAPSTIISEARNELAQAALGWGADWVLWIDADQTFPPDALLRLLSRKRAVIGCNYAQRGEPTGFTALVATTAAQAAANEIEEVESLGLGLCLVQANVLRMIRPPMFDFGHRECGGILGEDRYFFQKVREAGVKVFLDHALSWGVGHIHERPIMLSEVPSSAHPMKLGKTVTIGG